MSDSILKFYDATKFSNMKISIFEEHDFRRLTGRGGRFDCGRRARGTGADQTAFIYALIARTGPGYCCPEQNGPGRLLPG